MYKEQSLKKTLNLAGILILLIALGIGMLLAGCRNQNAAPTGSVETAPSDAGDPAVERVPLYWNLDRHLYTDESADGAVREKEEDGYYHVRFSVDGETVEYKVSGARVMENIDKYDLMGLEFDTDGYVVAVVDVSELTAGEVAVGEYVVIAGDTSITTCPKKSLEGQYATYRYAANVGIFNVMGLEPVGFVDTPQPVDTIRAFVNDAGEITHIFILTRLDYFAGPTRTAFCPECQEDVVWWEWSDKVALPNLEGHWYLAEDIVLENAVTLEKGLAVSVDLNGKTVSATSRRMYVINSGAKLTLTDSAGTGKMVGYRGKESNPSNTIGGMFYLNKGDGQTLSIYGGTYDASQIYLDNNGGVVTLNENQGTFNMYGGTLIGAGIASNGGAVYASSGTTFRMEGGTISGGHATGKGDNVYLQTGATFQNNGGTIDGGIHDGNILSGEPIYHCLCGSTTGSHIGKCDGTELKWLPWEESGALPSSSGNFYLSGNVFVAKAATLKNVDMNLDLNGFCVGAYTQRLFVVEGDTKLNIVNATGNGVMYSNRTKGGSDGAVILLNKECTAVVSLYGGILDGSGITSNKEGGVLAIRAGSGVFNMYGGGIIGAASAKSGDAIYLNAGGIFNMYGGWISDANTDDAAARLVVAQQGASFNHYGGAINEYVAPPVAERKACLCGSTTGTHVGNCDGTELIWTEWTKTDALPSAAGNYYLTGDVTVSKASTLTDAAVNLDLNGFTVSADTQRMFVVAGSSTLNIVDSVGTGKMVGTRSKGGSDGAMIMLNKDSTAVVGLYGGTLDASGITSSKEGGVLAIREGSGVFNMYGGNLVGAANSKAGDAVYLNAGGTFNLYGGEITDSNTDEAKLLVAAAEGAVFNQVGGTVTEYDDGSPDEPVVTGHTHCLCGASVDTENPCSICGSVAVVYTEWYGVSTPAEAGSYYLTEDATATATLFNVDYDLNICLCGHSLTAKEKTRAVTLTKGNTVVITGGCGDTGGSIYGVQGGSKTGDALFVKSGNLKLYNLTVGSTAAKVKSGGSLVEIGAGSENIGTVIAVNCTLKAIPCAKDVLGYGLVRVKAGSTVGGTAVTEDTAYAQTESGWNGFADQDYTGHTEVIDAAVEATCTADGLTEGKHCSVCGEVTVKQDTVPSPGHAYSTDYLAENADENSHYHVCTVCGEKDIGEAHTWNQEAATEAEDKHCTVCAYVAEARKDHVHVGTKVDAVNATCTTGGNVEYWICACGKWFSDAGCTVEITDKSTVNTDALGHVEVADAAVAATCTNPGKTAGKHCSVCSEVLIKQEEISALGHSEVVDESVAATCITPGKTAGKHCSVCSEVLVKQEEIPAAHNWSDDACTACNAIRHCLCGDTGTHIGACDGSLLVWMPWTGSSLPGTSGNWYLTKDVAADDYSTVTLTDVSINLDLHGHTVSAHNKRVLLINGSTGLNIMDSVGTGKIVGTRSSSGSEGAMILLNTDCSAVVSLYSGTLDASGLTSTKNGGVFAVRASTGVINMYGGKIVGAKSASSGDAVYLYAGTTFNMYGGEITDSNTADEAKQLVVAADGAVFNQTGGTVTEYVAATEPEPEPEPTEHVHCLCGASADTANACSVCGSVAVTYTAVTEIPATEGYYYLTEDVTLSAAATLADGCHLCLNGCTVSSPDKGRAMLVNGADVNVVITSGGHAVHGTIASKRVNKGTGTCIFVKEGTCTAYHVNFDGTDYAGASAGAGSLIEVGTASVSGTLSLIGCQVKMPASPHASYSNMKVFAGSTLNGVALTATASYNETIPESLTVVDAF